MSELASSLRSPGKLTCASPSVVGTLNMCATASESFRERDLYHDVSRTDFWDISRSQMDHCSVPGYFACSLPARSSPRTLSNICCRRRVDDGKAVCCGCCYCTFDLGWSAPDRDRNVPAHDAWHTTKLGASPYSGACRHGTPCCRSFRADL